MKKSLVIALALMLVLAFASSAMAAQAFNGETYLSTTSTAYQMNGAAGAGSTMTRTYTTNKFNADGTTNYPYEIYLPNEINPNDYRIHSSYAKNTDACASCHATHTAVGNYLLQWYSAYDTCMACHDGTVTSTYNVLDGRVGADADSAAPGGMFGLGGGSESNHNVTGAMEIAAAPGGSAVEDGHGDWAVEFGCESCHSPHGNGGNARLLAPDPNGYATKLAKANGAWFGYYSGGKFYDIKPGGSTPATEIFPTGIVAKTTGTISNAVYINGIYENTSVAGNTYFIAKPATLRDSLTQAVGPGYTFLKPGRESYFAISVNGTVSWSSTSYGPTDWIIDNSTGVTRAIYTGSGTITGSDVVKFFGIPTVKVAMNIDNYLNDGIADPTALQKEKVIHGTGMNVFCGACHLDYNTASAEVYDLRNDGKIGGAYQYDTGVYSKAHRHTVGTSRNLTDVTKVLDYEFADGVNTGAGDSGIFTCLTCHVAHGVSKDYWNRLLVATNAVGPSGDAWTDAELVELAGSSVLKRMPNMGTCETCHNKEAANDGYFANSNLALTPTEANNPTAGVTNQTLSAEWYIGDAYPANGFNWVGSAKCESCHTEFVTGWKENNHFTGLRTSVAQPAATCGDAKNYPGIGIGTTNFACHQAGLHAMANVPTATTFQYNVVTKVYGDDAGVTCEVCHQSGANHVSAPNKFNIANPGAKTLAEQTLFCAKCHGTAGATGDEARAHVTAATTSADLGTIFTGSPHGGPEDYALSKHFTLGIVGCTSCHDVHKEDAMKLEYDQLCGSCHDAFGPYSVAMDGSHAFANGLGSGVAIPDTAVVTLSAVNGYDWNGNGNNKYIINRIHYNRGYEIGVTGQVTIKSADGLTTYTQNKEGIYTLTSAPALAVKGVDYTFDSDGTLTILESASANCIGTYSFSYVNKSNPAVKSTTNGSYKIQ